MYPICLVISVDVPTLSSISVKPLINAVTAKKLKTWLSQSPFGERVVHDVLEGNRVLYNSGIHKHPEGGIVPLPSNEPVF